MPQFPSSFLFCQMLFSASDNFVGGFYAGTEEILVGSSWPCILALKRSTFAAPRKSRHLGIHFPDQAHAPAFS